MSPYLFTSACALPTIVVIVFGVMRSNFSGTLVSEKYKICKIEKIKNSKKEIGNLYSLFFLIQNITHTP